MSSTILRRDVRSSWEAYLAAVAASRVRVPAYTETTLLHIIICGLTASVLTVLSVLVLYQF